MLAISNIRLHKFTSNSPVVMHAFSPTDHSKELNYLDLDIDSPPLQHSLGLSWNFVHDTFTFCVANTVTVTNHSRGEASSQPSVAFLTHLVLWLLSPFKGNCCWGSSPAILLIGMFHSQLRRRQNGQRGEILCKSWHSLKFLKPTLQSLFPLQESKSHYLLDID